MDRHSASWCDLDHVRLRMSPSFDPGRRQSHFKVERSIHDSQRDPCLPPQQNGEGMLYPHNEQFTSSHSQNSEIQHIIDIYDHNHTEIPTDFELFDARSTGPPTIQLTSTFNNINPITASSVETQTYRTGKTSSPNAYTFPNQNYDRLPTTSMPPDASRHGNPEHDAWTAQLCPRPTGMPSTYFSDMSFDQMHYLPPKAQHLIDGPSPTLSQSSPFQTDFIEDGWDQRVISHHVLENSGSDELNDLETTDPCYAQLLYRCLKEAPDHTMALRDLYDWVKAHSQKAKDPKNRGWQNSVRHNLSMNAAFERVPLSQTQGVKKGSLWRLTPHALRDGVISTTRYRKDPKRKPERRSSPALKRQMSGAKGGQATRNATRRQQALREAQSFHTLPSKLRQASSSYIHQQPLESASPYFLDLDENVTAPMSNPNTPAQVQLMFESQPKIGLSNLNLGSIDFANGGLIGSHDSFSPDTPSLATEASYISEEAVHTLMSHTSKREVTSFPVDC